MQGFRFQLRYTFNMLTQETLSTISLTIIGAGRVGKTLARCMYQHAPVQIIDIVTRSAKSANAAVDFIGAGTARWQMDTLADADVFMLTVPDDQIADCCKQLARAGKLGPNSVVFHCSGALSSADLQAAREFGAAVASVHPIRSFADPALVSAHFASTYCGIEGDAAALEILAPLLRAIGAVLVPVQTTSKTLYHAAAVFASNYVVSMMSVAQNALVASGVPANSALALLLPLTRECIENVARLGPAAALTGPIARGDTAVVARQQDAVRSWDQQVGALYEQLAIATQRLADSRVTGAGSAPALGSNAQ